MMHVMKDIGGVEMPEFLARLTPDGAGKPEANVSEKPLPAKG